MFNMNYRKLEGEPGGDTGGTGDTGTGDTGTGDTGKFYDGFKDAEVKNFAITKGFIDSESVVNGYRNLEKLAGTSADLLLKLPGADSKPEDWNSVYDKLGRPSESKDYGLPVPEGQSADFSNTAGSWFHELGLNTKQAVGITEKWNAFQAEVEAKNNTDYQASVQDDTLALKTEWGQAYEKNIQLTKQVANSLGFDEKTIDGLEQALGYGGVMRMMANLGTKLGEDAFVNGEGGGGDHLTMEPEVAKAKIAELRSNKEWVDKYIHGDVVAKKEMSRLHRMAYPD